MKQAFLALACLALAATAAIDAQSPGCAPSNGLAFICDLQKPEDLVPIPGTHWLIVSGMEAGAGLHLIDTRAKRAQALYASGTLARQDRNRFASCPDLVDPRQAVLHGLVALADPSCAAGTPCPRGYAAAAIDPKTLVVTDLAHGPAAPPYTGTATAIQIDGEIWLSSHNGDRVAYGPLSR